MKFFKLLLIVFGSFGLLFLNPYSTKSETIISDAETSQGGQVVEVGAYHLELVTKKEDAGTHLDFYLQRGDTHEPIADASVSAQIQLPDGTEKQLDLEYDVNGGHYTILFPETATGEYLVKMTANINGEIVNGRFSFNQ
ncbi:hypothetical protein [Gloeocapsa sp. PCC 73106]|uniref:hypothetical protein n=1 Tax=Gloeocapsa sp. PCC 73106 TaxID=102232 RepID=UPI0002AC41BA|nr:hypothetical protein [Gloeocapsa sp. PCC 73106]ELR98941.1 hypothetical protein GLO73106DRAFT_00027840 [Gloeocapsa sp. PCC 73106]